MRLLSSRSSSSQVGSAKQTVLVLAGAGLRGGEGARGNWLVMQVVSCSG